MDMGVCPTLTSTAVDAAKSSCLDGDKKERGGGSRLAITVVQKIFR